MHAVAACSASSGNLSVVPCAPDKGLSSTPFKDRMLVYIPSLLFRSCSCSIFLYDDDRFTPSLRIVHIPARPAFPLMDHQATRQASRTLRLLPPEIVRMIVNSVRADGHKVDRKWEPKQGLAAVGSVCTSWCFCRNNLQVNILLVIELHP